MTTMKRRKKHRGRKPKWTLQKADKYALYESAVYDPEADVDFVMRVHREKDRPEPSYLREDFAGTCRMAAVWVEGHENRRAVCLDLDPEPMEWGHKRHLQPLGESANRVDQRLEDVLTATTPGVEVVTAFNFSYWIFKQRKTLLKYFKSVHTNLVGGGLFLLDIQGGPDVQREGVDEREEDGFWYIWNTGCYDAITGDSQCSISFEFPDDSRLTDAFVYDWRMWNLPEVRDILTEAGFDNVEVYWEGVDEDGEGNGEFQKQDKADNEDAWIAYLAAWKAVPGQ